MTRSEDQAGFTLLEFMVAFALLAAVASALMAAFAVAVRGDNQAAFVTRATLVAQSQLATLGVDAPLRPGTTLQTLANGYVLRSEIRPDRAIDAHGKAPITSYWVEVTVSDPAANGRRSVSLTSLEIDRGAAR